MIVLRDINKAPTAGDRMIPMGASTPAAKGRAISAVAAYLGDPDAILRVHAAWALGRIGGTEARRHLQQRRVQETTPEVVGEIDRALRVYASSGGDADR